MSLNYKTNPNNNNINRFNERIQDLQRGRVVVIECVASDGLLQTFCLRADIICEFLFKRK